MTVCVGAQCQGGGLHLPSLHVAGIVHDVGLRGARAGGGGVLGSGFMRGSARAEGILLAKTNL